MIEGIYVYCVFVCVSYLFIEQLYGLESDTIKKSVRKI